ncbi:unnamed protein product [Schistosoma margrebowiei]|uniref:Uncharacterized protein n=1 Tax=Schistosoma margrebowiei TaxID=48269 RepID=A0A183LRX9_9TREM|nr:unnamed protein product [Schistosoma margrebowiei]
MVAGGSQQEILDSGFVLFGTRQHGIPVILKELVLFDRFMVIGGSRQETMDPGFVLLGSRQQGVPAILRELVLPGGFDPMSINRD